MKRTTGDQRGFSLFEILVVLLLLAILFAVATPATGRFLRGIDFRKQTEKVAAVLRYARLTAISSGKMVTMKLSEDEPGVIVFSGGVNATKEIDLGEEDALVFDRDEIVFFPEGYVTPATIVYTREEKTRTIELDPLTALPSIKRSR